MHRVNGVGGGRVWYKKDRDGKKVYKLDIGEMAYIFSILGDGREKRAVQNFTTSCNG